MKIKRLLSLTLGFVMTVTAISTLFGCNGESSKADIPTEATTAYKTALGDVFPVMTYIGPTPEYFSQYENKMVENLIRDDVFKNLAETGINVICGHFENDEERVEVLNYCAKYGMIYLIRCNLFGYARWDGTERKILTYNDYSEEEKTELDDSFRAYLRKWSAYDGFGGICVGDETGYHVTPAFKRMKQVFDEECAGKLFYLNMFGPGADGTDWCDYNPYATDAAMSGLTHDSNITWAKVMHEYSAEVGLEVMSFDNYLFYQDNMSGALFSDIAKFKRAMAESETPVWYFVQDGQEGYSLRNQSYEESYYQMNAPLCVGVSGLCLYPGFSPLECGNTPQYSLYDRVTGEPTYYMDWYKEIFGQIHACDKVLMGATYKGTIQTLGGGVSEVVTTKELTDFYRLKKVQSTYSQIVVGCYSWKGHEVLWVFNNAIDTEKKAQPNLIFDGNLDAVVVKNGEEKAYKNKGNLRIFLNPGEAAMVVLGTDTLNIG